MLGNEELEIIDSIEDEEVEEPTGEETTPESEQESQESDELVVTIGDEPDAEEEEAKSAPQWVKDLRKQTREQARIIREQEAKLKELTSPKHELDELGKKPQLHDDGIEYDEEAFEAALLAWNEKKRKIEQRQREEQEKIEAQNRAYEEKLQAYHSAKTGLKVADFQDAEESVISTLSKTQQGILVNYADKPELVIYAIGKNEKELKRLAAITDPIAFALELKTLEREKIKVSTRKPETSPERAIVGNSTTIASTDKHLEKLEAEAERTGDRSKVIAYKRSLKKSA